jgi:IclR family acetate operon transcriptional repressor
MAGNLVNSIIKAFNTLDILLLEDYEKKGMALSSLSKATGIRPNTLHNILKTMIHCGYVKQNENSSYLIGNKCEQIGANNKVMQMLENEIQPILKELHKKTNEGIVFYTLLNGGKIPQISIKNNELININHSAYGKINFYEKITSRVLTAFADKNAFQEIIKRWGLPGKYWNDINDNETLENALKKIRKQGFGILDDPPPRGIISFAVPVFKKDASLLGTIGCFAPKFRCPSDKQKLIIKALKEAAKEIEKAL